MKATAAHIRITVTADHYDAECSICRIGVKCGPKFGPIPGEILIEEFVKQHAHKPKPERNRTTTGDAA